MVTFMPYEADYFDMWEKKGGKTVIYGAGAYGRRALPYLRNVAYMCDKHADGMGEYSGIPVIVPEKLVEIKETLFVVVCVKSETARKEIRDGLKGLPIDAYIYDYFNSISFDIYKENAPLYHRTKKEIGYVRLICEDSGWILHKFALKMQEELEKRGIRCSAGASIDPMADINHHVIYASCQPIVPDFNETFMITHIDSHHKVEFLKHQLKKARMGICMSRETMERLAAYGVPREKLCYINPAQDGVIKPKKYVLGITHKTHREDHRKKEDVLVGLCRALDPEYFAFRIMGSGWDRIVDSISEMGFEVLYYDRFDYDEYVKLIPALDYYLFWGFDEGSMGYLDALRAGIGTIVTPQGYHLDVKDGITYACRTMSDFQDVLLELQEKRKKTVHSVAALTWKDFTDKHLEVWNYLLGNERDIYRNQHMYEDGIFSVLRYDA